MAQTIDNSPEARIADLEAQVRSLRATNLTDLASVTDAAGRSVALSQLAFGQVAAADSGTVELWGVANAGAGGVAWQIGSPSVWVRVTGGRLRVDVGGALTASGNKCSTFYSYRVVGPVAASGDAGGAVAAAPAYDRAVEVQHSGTGLDQRAAASTFALHTGLASGWYLVESAYALSYSGSPSTPYGSVSNRRLAVTPY